MEKPQSDRSPSGLCVKQQPGDCNHLKDDLNLFPVTVFALPNFSSSVQVQRVLSKPQMPFEQK